MQKLTNNLLSVFAPVATILTYATLDEAVDMANSTRYGLGASVFGPDQDRCVQIAKRLECGMVAINDFAVYYVSYFAATSAPQHTDCSNWAPVEPGPSFRWCQG